MANDPKPTGKIEWMKVDDLSRDPEINVRPIDEARARRMSADFDIDALGVVTASRRKDGKTIILDGQHRCEALRFMGWNGEKIPVRVFDGLSREQEAKNFIMLNTQKAIGAIDKFLARLTAKEKIACAIAEIARQNGYVIDRQCRDGVIVAVSALEQVYTGKNQKIRGHNPKALHGTLHAISEAWGRTPHSSGASIIAGIGAFLLRYGDEIKLNRLIEKLQGIAGGPDGLVNRGRGKRELHGGNIAGGIAHYLVDEYNGGLRGTSRLLAWRE